MSYKLKVDTNDNTDEIQVMLAEIPDKLNHIEDKFLKQAAKITKDRTVEALRPLSTNRDWQGYKHMYQDVQARVITNNFGNKVVRVRGGQKTGTLWHLVNDGTFHSKATHFMDTATNNANDEIDRLIEKMLEDI